MTDSIIPIVLVVLVLSAGIVFFIVKRAVRMVIRLILFGVLLFVLLTGGLASWWYGGRSGTKPQRNENRRPAARTPR